MNPIFCELVDTGKTFLSKRIYKCKYCGMELALENANTNITCFKKQIDMYNTMISKTLHENPIYTGVDFGPDSELAESIGIHDHGDSPPNKELISASQKLPEEPAESVGEQIQTQKTELCSKQEIDQRMEICKTCEYYQEDACILCGCRIVREKNHQNKLANKNAACPAGKWGVIN